MNYFIIPGLKNATNPNEIVAQAARAGGFEVSQLYGQRRHHSLVAARYVAMYLIKKRCGYNLVQLAKLFNRDHTSVIYALRYIDGMISISDPLIIELFTRMDEKIA